MIGRTLNAPTWRISYRPLSYPAWLKLSLTDVPASIALGIIETLEPHKQSGELIETL